MVGRSGKLLDKRIHERSKHKRRHKHWWGITTWGMGLDTNLHTRLAFWEFGILGTPRYTGIKDIHGIPGIWVYWVHLDTLA
jgi:hypothetical protein